MNKIGIIGCGWLGLALAKKFVEKGYSVHGSTTTKSKIEVLNKLKIRPFLISLPTDSDSLVSFLQVDYLIINIPPGRKDPKVADNFPLKIKSILKTVPDSTKILFVSSTSVYGNLENEVDEKTIELPVTNSGKALFEVEKTMRVITEQNKDEVTERSRSANFTNRTTVIRLSGLVGPDRIPGRFFAGKSNIPNGDAPVNLIHRADCIKFIEAIIDQEKWGEVFNLSANKHPTKREFYTKFCKEGGFQLPMFLDGGSSSKVIVSDKIKRSLGLKLIYPDPMEFRF